jgi:Ca2+-binding EF-hand superfamily protein
MWKHRCLAAAWWLAAGAFVPAQTPVAKEAPPAPGDYFKHNVVLEAMDTNHDAVISAEELAQCVAVLKRFDKNGDGILSGDEVAPRIPEKAADPGTQPESMASRLMAFDKNHDAKLSRKELPASMQALFDRGDVNKDGFLTKEEIDRMEAALAPPKGDPKRENTGPPGGFIRMDPMLITLDVDHNGEISTAEMENAPTVLKRLDTNHDGQLTENELRPRPSNRSMEEVLTGIIKQHDKDGDGRISTAEMPDRLRAMFERADIDRDGFVTLDELKALVKREGGLYGDRAPAPRQASPKK